MGYGDAIIATNLARGLSEQGKMIGFYGRDRMIRWTEYCEQVFANNPNIARPGDEKKSNVIRFQHYKENIRYGKNDGSGKWIWNMKFRISPGEFFFGPFERITTSMPFIVIEPNVAWQRTVSGNKDWGDGKYERLAEILTQRGHKVVQFIHDNSRRRLPIPGHMQIPTKTFREAIAWMSAAKLVIAPEGANQHAAAALGKPAVIVWGGFSPVKTMGYDSHINLTGGAEPCGNCYPCDHCHAAMDRISVDEVAAAAERLMQ